MGVKTYNDSNVTTKYVFNRKAGRSIIERYPVFSPDGESLLVIVENVVRVYNIQTGDCTRTLETEASVDELIAIQFPDNDTYNLYGCSNEGRVTTWTWENGAVLREMTLKLPENMRVLTFNLVNDNDCFIVLLDPKSKKLFFGVHSIKTGHVLQMFQMNVWYFEDMIRVAIFWCNGERYAAVTNGTAMLFIQNLLQQHINQRIKNQNALRILSVAAHRTESAVATTDTLGRVVIYRGDFSQKGIIGKEQLHWHFLPAIAVCFSLQGSYVYSGGMEKVLVKWTVADMANKANEKAYIPRLPGIVRFIATNNTHVATVLSNNSIVIANAQLRVQSTILECGGLSPVARAFGTPLVYHQRLGSLLMGGRTGHLQLYSTTTDKVLFNIDITGINNTPPERFNLIPIETEVTCAAVSGNGSWLVTSEYRNDGISYPEERLKFWALEIKNTTPFRLNTCVNLSHGGCKVISIAIDNRGGFCVSAGGDQKFRIWKKENVSQTRRKIEVWNCITACYYSSGIAQFLSHGILNNYKNGKMPPKRGEAMPYMREFNTEHDIIRKLINVHKEHTLLDENAVNSGVRKDEENDMAGVDIAHDGSLIAAWFGCKLTLWDTHLCNLRTTLSHPALRPKGVDVKFGSKDACHYLACTTESCVAVWSLLSLTMKWLVQINPTTLAADPLSNKMAVVTTNNDVYVFTPHNATPILTHKKLLDPQTGVFKACTFGASSGEDCRLFVMRNDSEIYCLEPEQSMDGSLEVISRRKLPASNFSALLAEQQLSAVKSKAGGEIQPLESGSLANTAIAKFLSAAPHMVPPVSLICTSFLLHLSGQKPQEPQEETHEEIEVEEPSSDEDDTVTEQDSSYAPKPTQLWTPNYEMIKEKRLLKILKEPLLDLHATESIFGV